MRICRVRAGDEITYAAIDALSDDLGITDETLVAFIDGHPFGDWSPQGSVARARDVELLAPVIPSKIVGIGRNYRDHASEMGGEVPTEPLMFLKPSTSVIGPGDAIRIPWQSEKVEHEAELAIVIGRVCRDVSRDRAAEVIFGYTCGNDVSARDLQRADGQWARAKGFDTFCPLGPWIDTELDWTDAAISCTVNGEIRQSANTGDVVFGVPDLIAAVTSVMTLLPGDVILTGTPSGVGPIVEGDTVAVTIQGLGTLTNTVVDRG